MTKPRPKAKASRRGNSGKAAGRQKRARSSEPVVRVLTDSETVARAAAGEFVRLARKLHAKGHAFRVALSGGSTPRRTYEILAQAPFRDMVDWTRVHFFWGDERCVPPDHPDSNYRMALEAMLSRVPAVPARIHRIEAERVDADAAAREYQREIARVFGATDSAPTPAFDLILLGLGPDGHTASLFPGTAALREVERWVVANLVPKLGARRMTFTYPLLNRASHLVFLSTGAEKSAILAEVLEGPEDRERLPAQAVRPSAGTLTWIVDSLAAAKLVRTTVTKG
jgi:6-phosphogluconolactonase